MTRLTFAILVGLACLGCGSAGAETRLLRTVKLDERLTDQVPTSGTLLAGLHQGRINDTTPFNTQALALGITRDLRNQSVCVRVATRDGRYRALGSYAIPDDINPTPNLDFPSQHGRVLSTLSAEQFAVRASVAKTCDDGSAGVIVPVRLAGAQDDRVLTVLLNPGDATARVRLVSEGGQRSLSGAPVRCTTVKGGPRIAFSQRCEIRVEADEAIADAQLEVVLVELTDGRTTRLFPIALPTR